MKDYSNYRKYINVDMISYSGNFHFNEQLKQEGTNIKINEQSTQNIDNIDTVIRAIIRNTGIENKEATEERSIMIGKEYNYKIGDYVEYLNDIYMTTTLVDKDNPFFNTSKMKRCNHLLKWVYKGKLYQSPSIVTNATKYTTGIEASGLIVEVDARYTIDIPYSEETKTIQLGCRFIINNLAWEVTQIDYTTSQGILNLTLAKSSKTSEYDNLELGIADYYLHNYVITLNSTSETLQEGGTYQITTNVTDKGVVVTDVNVTYTSSDDTIAIVDSTSGLITAIKEGDAIITASIGEVSSSISLTITTKTTTPVISYGYSFSQGTTIRQYVTSTLVCTETTDSVSTLLNISCTWDTLGQSLISNGKLTVTTKSSSSIAIKNVSVNTNTVIYLTITDSDTNTVIASNIPITLTGM
jgi:uncharacterized protein YjdB